MTVQAVDTPVAGATEPVALGRAGVLRRLARDKIAAGAGVVLALIVAAAILALAFLLINLLVDVLYVYLDPRIQRS